MTPGLTRINAISHEEATANLLNCCGSENWARQMAELRPFRSEEDLLDAAERLWRQLNQADWLEAFRHHPQIGERAQTKASPHANSDTSSHWAAAEQSATRGADQRMLDELTLANRAYLDRFGYIFIVCATGKSTEEMLALLRQRLQNDPVQEIAVAAEEQSRITKLRLVKLLHGK